MAKTTLEIPDDVMRAVRIRAVDENRRLKEVVADLLRRGLTAEPVSGSPPSERGWGDRVHARFAALGGVELEVPSRRDMPRPPVLPA
jgi:plasmid stability protein